MKLDLILLDVRRNVDNDANICKYNSIYSVVPPPSPTTISTNNNKSDATNNTCCSNLAYMLQQLSETTQCYEARQYLEQQIEYGQCRLRQLQQRQLQTAQQHQHAKEQLQLIVRQQQQARQPQQSRQQQQQQQQQSTPLARSRRSRSNLESSSTPEDDDCSMKKSTSADQIKSSTSLTAVTKKPTSVVATSRKIELEEGRTTSSSSTTSTSVTSNHPNNNAVMKTVAKQILKYIKTSDRYLCFASCLLKSRAFHQTYPMPTATHNATVFLQGSTLPITVVSLSNNNRSNSPSTIKNNTDSATEDTSKTNAETRNTTPISTSVQRKLPLIQLPRTKHGKPFVPIKIAGSSSNSGGIGTTTNVVSASSSASTTVLCSRKAEENKYPLSVSHQYPFVGMIRIAVVDTEAVNDIQIIESNRQQQKLDYSNQQNSNDSKVRTEEMEQSGHDSDSDNEQCKQQEKSNNNKASNNAVLASNNNNAGAMIGFDIVVFDEINYNLYDTVQEFVVVFQHMFSISEFKLIIDCYESPEKQLRELYLRWAVKEAYTKALGVGLGYDFSSFQVLLDLESLSDNNVNNNNNSNNSRRNKGDDSLLLWDWLVATSTNTSNIPTSAKLPKVFGVTGSIQHQANNHDKLQATNNERFAFFFCPLYKDDSILFNNAKASSSPSSTLVTKSPAAPTSSKRRVNPLEMVGCACACIGPLNIDSDHNDVNCSVSVNSTTMPPSSSSTKSCPATFAAKAAAAMNEIECSVEWTDIEQLISWHSPSTTWK